MNVKIQCPCGARYSFDVEPLEGRLPAQVQCPVCQADGTELGNQIIAQSLAAEGATAAPYSPAPAPEALAEAEAPAAVMCARHPTHLAVNYCFVCKKPICAECMATFGYLCSVGCRYEAEQQQLRVPVFKGQRRVAEAQAERKIWRGIGAVAAVLLLLAGGWGWYVFSGSKPHLKAWLKLPEGTAVATRFLGRDRILVVTPTQAALHDRALAKTLWSTTLDGAERRPEVEWNPSGLWICLGNKVVWLDAATGNVKQNYPIQGALANFTPGESNLLVVSAADETHRTVLNIALPGGEAVTQEISVPRREVQKLPDELPPNVQPTAGVLLAQALDEQKFNRPLDAMSSEFFSAGQNLVEMRVKLLEAKVNYLQTIKPRSGPSQLNGQTTASTSAKAVASELFNDIKRSQTGGVREVDESRYNVRLRRWIGSEPVEWTGEVTGAPSFFPLKTVDLLVAGTQLMVFDKAGHRMFDSKLTYALDDRFTKGFFARRLRPAVERGPMLYFFDQGVLTAFSLPDGAVKWRLTSFGISGIQFDPEGMLYVDSTEAGPEDIQYADTITFDKIPAVLLKVDPMGGKILWKAEDRGQTCFISGKYLYAESLGQGGFSLANGLSEALNSPQAGGATHFNFYRIDPATGETLWSLYDARRPESIDAQDTHLLFQFGDDLEVFDYLDL